MEHPLFTEIRQISQLLGDHKVRYTRFLNILKRVCISESVDFQGDYATLFSRLFAVCQVKEIDYRPADRFRHNARLVLNNELIPSKDDELADIADLCCFIHYLYGVDIPSDLPQHIRSIKIKHFNSSQTREVYGIISGIDSLYSFRVIEAGNNIEYNVSFFELQDTASSDYQTTKYLYKGANVCLLDAKTDPKRADSLLVYMVVVEPDYLIDVSALTACIKPYGSSPLNFLLNRFSPNISNRAILMGNLANQFMDDCINRAQSEDNYLDSLKQCYEQYILEFSCLEKEEVDLDFFEQARIQYNNIYKSVSERFKAPDIGIDSQTIILEPSFICPSLGLRGRLDVMTENHLCVLELKSGKADFNKSRDLSPKADHLLQMTLYGEILRRNFNIDWNKLRTYLFYSTYPLLFNERPSSTAIRDILQLRNGIIYLLYLIRKGDFLRLIPLFNPQKLNQFNLNNRFYLQYLLPQIVAITEPLQNMQNDFLLLSYFVHFISFIEREMFMNKTSDARPDSLRGFASTWNADWQTKKMSGNIIAPLTVEGYDETDNNKVNRVRFTLPQQDEDLTPNFSVGDMVQIYSFSSEEDNVTNKQLIRGNVTSLTSEHIDIKLTYPQNSKLLSKNHYAIEHDSTDGPSNQQYRNLFAFLTATSARKDLLLGRREPEVDKQISLLGSYPETVEQIILQAKQAKDYYLLIGPPGTGKTNLALKSMVQEYLLTAEAANRNCETYYHDNALLLTAYTNRAVDEICSMLDNLSQSMSFDYLRIGSEQTTAAVHHSHLLSVRAHNLPNRKVALSMIQNIPIIVGTVVSLTNAQIIFNKKRFHTAIIDEASQLLEPQILGLLSAKVNGENAIQKFVLIGDHKQLPAVVQLPENQTMVEVKELHQIGLFNLRNSLFERLHWLEKNHDRSNFVGLLNHQGRMHSDIAQFVNAKFYDGKLCVVPLPHQIEKLDWQHTDNIYEQFVAQTRIGFVRIAQLKNTDNLCVNIPEASAITKIIEAICTLHSKNALENFEPAKQIGIIVPFRSQISAIRNSLRKQGLACADTITIDTVECYQGSQRDYILYSTTISEPYQVHIISNLQEIDGNIVDRKLNVALTRARKQLFIFGNPGILRYSPLYSDLMSYCRHLDMMSTSLIE